MLFLGGWVPGPRVPTLAVVTPRAGAQDHTEIHARSRLTCLGLGLGHTRQLCCGSSPAPVEAGMVGERSSRETQAAPG